MGTGVAVAALVAFGGLAAACASGTTSTTGPSAERDDMTGPTATIVLVGDVMLGRNVADVVANDPESVFESVRPMLAAADLAVGNLESPLTSRAHVVGDHALEADPASAELLARAGFDVMSLANNHAGDGGPATVMDSIAALASAGIAAVGGGADVAAATAPLIREVDGVRVALLAFDLTFGGPAATGTSPGVARWDADVALAAVAGARASADVVVVGIHGGIELLGRPDPVLAGVVDDLTSWGVDIVWGQGSHLAYPVALAVRADGGVTVQAPGLGNALFDQTLPGTDAGTVLEVLVGRDGVRAWRTAEIATYLRMRLDAWTLPAGDAVTVDGEWWSAAIDLPSAPTASTVDGVEGLRDDALVVEARVGDVDGDGADDVVVSYRRPWEPRLLQQAVDPVGNGSALADSTGRSAHLAWFHGGRIRWGAGTLPQPVAMFDVCDDGLALGVTTLASLADPAPPVVAGGAWWWREFGFSTAPLLDGSAVPVCADPDGDGRTTPALVRRRTSLGPADPSESAPSSEPFVSLAPEGAAP